MICVEGGTAARVAELAVADVASRHLRRQLGGFLHPVRVEHGAAAGPLRSQQLHSRPLRSEGAEAAGPDDLADETAAGRRQQFPAHLVQRRRARLVPPPRPRRRPRALCRGTGDGVPLRLDGGLRSVQRHDQAPVRVSDRAERDHCPGHHSQFHSRVRLHGGRVLVRAVRAAAEGRAHGGRPGAHHGLRRARVGARSRLVLRGDARAAQRPHGTVPRRVRVLHLLHGNPPPQRAHCDGEQPLRAGQAARRGSVEVRDHQDRPHAARFQHRHQVSAVSRRQVHQPAACVVFQRRVRGRQVLWKNVRRRQTQSRE